MPHYADGTKAELCDIVIGTTYNRKGTQVGYVKAITSESDTCNCQVTILATILDKNHRILCSGNEFDYAAIKDLTRVI